MDMVGEALRANNGVMTMSECPDHLPCYVDGLAKSIMNYVWRTNDIVYLPDAPRGRPGGQYFPRPMVEKNGSGDAFRFFIHKATGGSDHICFNNPTVGVPGGRAVHLAGPVVPRRRRHAGQVRPDADEAGGVHRRRHGVGRRERDRRDRRRRSPTPCRTSATPESPSATCRGPSGWSRTPTRSASMPRCPARRSVADFAVNREMGALRSIDAIASGSPAARRAVDDKVQQWELYREGLKRQISGMASARRGAASPARPARAVRPAQAAAAPRTVAPAFAPEVKGLQFSLGSWPKYVAYLKEHPDAIKATGLTPQQATSVANYVNGRRSAPEIRDCLVGESGLDVPLDAVVRYLDLLKSVGWIK